MRRVPAIGAVAAALVVAGCTSGPPPTPSPAPPSVAVVASSAAASPTPAPVDLTLTLTNPAGHPACGFYFWTGNPGGTTHLSLGVAVTVTGGRLADVVEVDLAVDGSHTASARFQGGTLIDGKTYTPPGTGLVYLTADDRLVPPVFVQAPASATVTVTVDPANRIVETNENNNTLTLRVTPTRRKDTLIDDNQCAMVP